jgi:hypothetical protein
VGSTRLASELITELRDRADLVDMEVRHPDATLLRYLTQSLRALRNELTAAGFTGLLDWSTSAALPTAPPVTGENFLEVAWPTEAVEIHGFDVNSGSRWYPLARLSLGERRDFLGHEGPPQAFLIRSLPKETQASSTAIDTNTGKIQVYPHSSTGLSYRIQYLAAYPELTSVTHIVQGFDGDWIEWVLWDATIKALFKDDEMDPSQDQKAVREREMVKGRIITNINRVNRAGAIVPSRRSGGISRRVRG